MVDLWGIQNAEVYGFAGASLIGLIIWYLFRRFQGGRLGLQRRGIREDKQMGRLDRQILVDIKQEHDDAVELKNLFYELNVRASQLNFNVYEPNIKSNFDYIVEVLKILSSGDKSVLNDRAEVDKLFSAIDFYLRIFSNSQDTTIAVYVKKIRTTQRSLFRDIIEQDDLLRQKFRLLRQEEQETFLEEGASRAA